MVDEITAAELHARIEDGDDVQVIDVRPERMFRRGHIPGAENVPFTRFARAVADREWSEDIVVVCPIGESSLQAARLLEAYEGVAEDASVSNLAGGYDEWEYELERG
jgi:rhodanese-related sulfurtransferase